jgi:ketosteroid isomerase-like protein
VEELVAAWLTDFETAVRSRDFEAGANLYEASGVFFGTRAPYSFELTDYMRRQWESIWHHSEDFRFTDVMTVSGSGSIAFCAVTWANETQIDSLPVSRTGRATFVFSVSENGLRAVHSHFSETPHPQLPNDGE